MNLSALGNTSLSRTAGTAGAARTAGSKRRFRPGDLPQLLSSSGQKAERPLSIRLAGRLAAMAAPGGGETQLLALARHLPALGLDARLWRPWEDRLWEIDCLHLLGSAPEHLEVVEVAQRQGVPVALSTIAWFDAASLWHESRSWSWRMAAVGKFMVRATWPQCPSWRRRLYHAVDVLLPNSQAEAEQLVRYFEVPRSKIVVVPNGAEERFADASPHAFARRVSGRGFVLYAGRIEPRKNQLGFLQAMQGSDVPIVILGDVVPGHEEYFNACRRVAGPEVKFVDGIRHEDPLLASAYAACGCLVLASWFETPGLVALEAALQGVPLVLPVGGCAREYFGGWADYVNPADPQAIRRKTLSAVRQPRSQGLAQMVRQRYTWQVAAEQTRAAYLGIIDRPTMQSARQLQSPQASWERLVPTAGQAC